MIGTIVEDGKTVLYGPAAITFVGWIIYFLILLIKVKWRAIYFPLLSLLGYFYLLLCIGYVIIPIIIILLIISAISTAETYATDGVYECRSCRRKFSSEGQCPYCGGDVY